MNVLVEGLGKLEAAGVIRRQTESPRATFAFKHAMIEEAAYASILKEERRDLHARAAERLGGLGPNHDSSQLAALAHHYSRAGLLPRPWAPGLLPDEPRCSVPPTRK